MSGTSGLIAPSYLPTLYGSSSPGVSLLSTLSVRDASAIDPASASGDPVSASGDARIGEPARDDPGAAEPRVQHDIAQFTRALAAARTPAQLLADPTALKVLLTANGLGDQTEDPTRSAQALLSDPSKADAMVNGLTDPRWPRVNQIYSFATRGLSALSTPKAVSAVTEGYAEAVRRTNQEQRTPDLAITNRRPLGLVV